MHRVPACCFALFIAASAFLIAPAAAEEKPKPKPEKIEFSSGKITKVSPQSITISEHKQFVDELTKLTVDDSTKVLLPPPDGTTGANRKPRDGKIADLKPGDIVSASFRKEGMLAIKISVAEPAKPRKK